MELVEFAVETDRRLQAIDVTEQVVESLPVGARGLATFVVSHTTCGIAVNEAEPRLLEDFGAAL